MQYLFEPYISQFIYKAFIRRTNSRSRIKVLIALFRIGTFIVLSPTGTPKRQTGIREQSALTADSAKNIFTIYDLLSNSELLYTWQKVII